MILSFRAAGVIAAACMLSCACGSKTETATNANVPGSPAANRPELPLAHVDQASAGVIRGVVKFRGQAPKLADIDFSSNPQCEHMHLINGKPDHAQPESVSVNANGTLRNVLVWVSSGLPEARWEPPSTPAKIDQSACLYVPHVLALMVNQELQVANSDAINHDVHAESKENEPFNVLEPPRSQTISHRFVHQEVWFPITCGVHPWMKTYIAVVGHPFFAVTGRDGAFELKGVPPGTYTVEAVQETFGRKKQQVSLSPQQTAILDFTYAE